MTGSRLFDPGLQPERTELAWRRTALAIGVGSLLALRLFPPLAQGGVELVASLAPGILGLLFAAWLVVRARVRYRRWNQALVADPRRASPGAALLLAVTVFVMVSAVAGAVIVGVVTAR
ncbi:DUF202 domain-containing protein [Microbacterium sp.]|uniref:DUF202 domain-containing protein n=1 Tax=Microbacterium sp. TaxID=51671 RepID=UPI0028122FA6|nr:DUF202 domain-containing protein [Microbacterium sp.]